MTNVDIIIQLAEHVYNQLSYSKYKEGVFEKALVIELRMKYRDVRQQYHVPIYYIDTVGNNHLLTNLIPDIYIDESIIIELKSIKKLDDKCRDQLKHYMKLLNSDKGYLINFGNKDKLEYEIY